MSQILACVNRRSCHQTEMGQAPGGEGLCTKRGRSSVLNMLGLRFRESQVETRRAVLPRPDGEAGGLSWRRSGVFCLWLVFKGMRSDGVWSSAEDLKIGSRDIPALLAAGEEEAPAKEMEREQPARERKARVGRRGSRTKSPRKERALGCVQRADGLGRVGTDTDS